ncbi:MULTISPECIES: hypothetical protein [unclassified Flavobacterium]|uniref:hypothetical protein n=1 Tax=unclassified Flavobacterium TaxID=196869 RepID=UPI003F934389
MELKDGFYILGILSTFIIGLLNYLNTTKNRRNFLRELVYKEQFRIMGQLNSELHQLNLYIIKGFKEVEELQNIKLKIIDIDNLIYSNNYLLPSKLFDELKELISVSEEFVLLVKQEEISTLDSCHDRFSQKYWDVIQSIIKCLGISELFVENNNIIKRVL